jgi:PPOX class probable F420-dependent enzyme
MRALRDPRAVDVLGVPASPLVAARLAGHHHVLLVTRRRDGREVATPIWFAVDGQRLVMRSGAADPKIARIRRDPRVRVAPCDPRGRPVGLPMAGRARVLTAEEEVAAERALREALGLQRRIYDVVRAPLLAMAYLEVVPDR